MNEMPSSLFRFGPLLFYAANFILWALFSLPLFAGVDIRKPLGMMGFIAVPAVGLLIFVSAGLHFVFILTKRHGNLILPLLLVNLLAIFGYIILVFLVLTFALYR